MKSKEVIIISIFLVIDVILCITGFVVNKVSAALNDSFHLNGNDKVVVGFGEKYVDAGYSANIDGKDYRQNVVIESNLDTNKVGKYTINYSLTYKSYNKTIQRVVSVIDNAVPVIQLGCKKDLYMSVNNKINDCVYKAIDNYDGDITKKVVVTSNVDTKVKGDYKVTYSVTDSNNNTTTEEVNVHVTDKFKHTYIVVSLSQQKLRYYVNNEIYLESPITSGKYNLTKPGTYKINKKVRNTYLVGKNYKSFVKYWMAYSGSKYGIHDASWRDKFGGMDYYVNGSHGCVNVPTLTAKKLYSVVEVGTPVYIKKTF